MKLKNLAAALWLGAAALLASVPGVALAQSAALVTGTPVTDNCASWAGGNGIKDTGVKCAGGNVQVDAAGIGSAVLTPNIYGLGAAGLLNNMSGKHFFFTRSTPTGPEDGGDFMCYRHADYTVNPVGADPAKRGFVNPCSFVWTIAEPGGYQRFEWAALSRLDNYSMQADDTENTAHYIQIRKFGTAPSFALVNEVIDTHAANPATGSVAQEIDMSAFGTDNNNARVLLDLWARNGCGIEACSTTAYTEAAWGMRLNTGPNAKIKNGITFNGAYGNGINFVLGAFDSTAITLGDGHALAFDNGQLRKMFHSAGVTYMSTPSGNLFSWSDAGQFTASILNTGSDINFSGSTSAYPMLRRNGASIDFKKADNSGYTSANAEYFVANGGRYCLDITCVRSWWVQGGVTYLNTGSGNVVSFTDGGLFSANAVSAGSTLYVNTGGKVCLNGTPCTVYISYTGGNVQVVGASLTASTVGVSSSGGMIVDVSAGATCTGAPTSAFRSVKGVVLAC